MKQFTFRRNTTPTIGATTLKKQKNLIKTMLLAVILLVGSETVLSSTIFKIEFATTLTPTINGFTEPAYPGIGIAFSNTSTKINQTAANASSGYTGASGSGVVLLGAANLTLTLTNINTSSYSDLGLSFGLKKGKKNDQASGNIKVEYKDITNNGNWTELSLPSTTFNTNWTLITTSGAIPSSTNLSLRFTHLNTTARGIDDILLIGTSASNPTIISPSPTSLSGFSTTIGTASLSQTFTIEGSNLTADLVVTAPSNYEVRENGSGSFGSSVSFTPSSGTVEKTIEVRIAASAGVGSPAGNVVCSSTGATSQNVAVSGTVSAPSYTITPSSNNESFGTVSLSGTIITGAPAVGYTYASPAYTVTSGTATVSQSGNDFTVAPSSDCAVRINFQASPTYTLSLSNDGSTYASGVFPLTTYAGNSATLPTLDDCGGYTFVGWDTNSATTSAPTYAPGATYTTTAANVTLYAVYSKTSGGGSSDVTFNVAAIAAAESWVNGTQYSSYTISPITITYNGGANDGKYYSSDDTWRSYLSGNGTVTITSSGGDISAVTSTPSQSFTKQGDKSWKFTASSNTNFKSFVITYGSSTTTYTTSPGCCNPPTTALSLSATSPLTLSGANVSTAITVTGGNGGTVNYTVNPSSTGSMSGNTFTATATGTYTITGTQALNGPTCGGSDDVTIVVNPAVTYSVSSTLTGCTVSPALPATVDPSTPGIMVTVTPNSCYTLPASISVTMGGTPLTVDTEYLWDTSGADNLFIQPTGGFSGNIVITITATQPQYAITYSTGLAGWTPTQANVACGGSFTAATPADGLFVCEDESAFAGWSTNASATAVQYAPGAPINPVGDMTLYGVWSSGTASDSYAEVTELTSGAEYLVVGFYNNTYMPIKAEAFTTAGQLATTIATVSGGKITTTDASLIWTVTETSGSSTFYNASTGKYMAMSAANVTLSNTATNFATSVTSGNFSFTNEGYRLICYRNSASDASKNYAYAYGESNERYVYLFKRESSTTYSSTPSCTLACTDALDLTAVMTASADAVNLNFDGIATATLAVSTSGTDAATAGTWAVSCSNASATSCSIDGTTVTLETATAGSYPVKAVFTPTNSAYCPRSVTTTITVLATPTVTIVDVTPLTFTANCGEASVAQSVSVSGWNLTANVTVTAPTGFEVSTDNSTYSSSVSFTKDANGKVDNQTFFVRANAPAQSDVDLADTLTVTSTSAQTAKLVVSATVSCLEYTVTFEANGTTFHTYTGYAGTSVTFPATNPAEACEGFAFDGWAAASVSDASTSYTKVTSLTTPSENTTLYAVYANSTSGSNATDLFISEYIEGSSNNKAIEIYNGTGSSVDLSGYELHHYNNGSLTATYTLSLSGILANNDVFVIANNSSTIFGSVVDLSTTNAVMTFNGDDAIVLYKKSTTSNVDIFGRIGEDPGASWGTTPLITVNKTLVRKSLVTGGVTTNPSSGFPTLATEWDSYAEDTWDYLGSHTFDGGATYTTTPACGPRIKGTKDIMVTSANGVMVKTITDLRVEATQLTSRDDVAASNVTITATSLNSKFNLRAAGVSSTGVTSISLATSYTAATLDSTINVLYTPTSAGVMDTGRIALRVYKTGGTTDYALDTITVIGRSLPATFVIAANTGSGWVALPNDLSGTAATPVAAYPVTVDNASNPTKATYAPSNAVYAGAKRSATYQYQSGLRFKSNTEVKHLQASSNDTKVWLPTTNSATNQTWVLEAADFIDYAVHLDITETTTRRLQLSSGNIGHYTGTGTLRLLPIEEECRYFPAPVVEVDSKTSTTATLMFSELEGATGYEISPDSTTWSNVTSPSITDGAVTLTISGLTAATSYTYYVRGVDSGSTLIACSEGGKVTFTTTNCDYAPTVTVTSIAVTVNNCGTLTFGYAGLGITTESETCPFTKFGIVMDTVNTFNKNPQFIEFGTTTLTALADTTITIAKAGTYYFAAYATNEVGTTITASKTSVDVEGLSGLAIMFKDNNNTAAMINGSASTRVTYLSESDGAVTWTVKNPAGTTVDNTIASTGYFTGTAMGLYTIIASQEAAGGYCAATVTAYVEVRNPMYFGYITNCSVTNNNNIEVIEQDVDSMRVVVDDANVVQIEIVRENSGGGEGGGGANELFFAKYFEGSGSLKLLSIFNGTSKDINLSGYKIQQISNVNTTTPSTSDSWDLSSLGTISKGQEIMMFTRPTEKSVLDCSSDFLDSVTTKNAPSDNPRWIECTGTSFSKVQFSGNDALWLVKNDVTIDAFGISVNKQITLGKNCRDEAAWVKEGYNMDYKKTAADFGGTIPDYVNVLDEKIELTTARNIMFRSNTVVNGQNAVTKNVDDFITLTTEWIGRNVCNQVATKDGPYTCAAYKDLSLFDYADYFQRYEPVTEKITLDGTPNPDGTFTITTDDFAGTSFEGTTFEDLHCNTLKINGYNGDNLVTSLTYKVPIIVKTTMNTDNDSVFNIDKQGKVICPDCDVVIRDAATLTVVPKGYNTLRDVYVYADARLSVPASKTYQMRKLYIQSENNKVGYALVEGTLAANTGIGHTKRIDAMSWYDFTLPYSCKVVDIARTNGKILGTYGTDWEIKYYDGAKRAAEGTPNGAAPTNWVQVASNATLQPGVGYIIGIGGTHNANPAYKVRFALPNLEGQIYTETNVSDKVKAVIGHTGEAAQRLPCHQGWNYIGNPFVSRFNGATQHGEVPWTTDLLLNGYYTDGLTGQTYDETFTDIYVAVQRGEGGATDWVQTQASEAMLSPFRAFFIQAVGDGNVDFRKASRDLPQAVLQRVANQDDVTSLLRLNLTGVATGSNYTELKLHSRFSMAYEVGHDMLRMMSYKTAPEPFILDSEGYYLIYSAADHKTAEESVIPVGFYASASDTYTFSLSKATGLSDYEAVYLKDNTLGITTNLLSSNYTFTSGRTRNTARFVLYLQKRQNITTDVTIVEGETPIAYLQGDAIVIENLPEGSTVRIIDAVGRVLLTTNEHSGIVRFHTPVSGAYMIQVLTPKENYTIKTIL